MENKIQDKLAELIQRELSKLPARPAPATLIPRVLARIEQQKRRWWQQPWTNWPFLAKVISFPAVMLCAGSFLTGLLLLSKWQVMPWIGAQTGELLRPLAPAWEFGAALANSMLLSIRSLEQHWILLSATVVFLMYLACLAVGTMCFRVALPKR